MSSLFRLALDTIYAYISRLEWFGKSFSKVQTCTSKAQRLCDVTMIGQARSLHGCANNSNLNNC